MTAIESLVSFPRRRFVPELLALGVTAYREILPATYRVMFRIVGQDIVLMGIFDGRRDLEETLIVRAIGDLS